jgi:hypothetical protein
MTAVNPGSAQRVQQMDFSVESGTPGRHEKLKGKQDEGHRCESGTLHQVRNRKFDPVWQHAFPLLNVL